MGGPRQGQPGNCYSTGNCLDRRWACSCQAVPACMGGQLKAWQTLAACCRRAKLEATGGKLYVGSQDDPNLMKQIQENAGKVYWRRCPVLLPAAAAWLRPPRPRGLLFEGHCAGSSPRIGISSMWLIRLGSAELQPRRRLQCQRPAATLLPARLPACPPVPD